MCGFERQGGGPREPGCPVAVATATGHPGSGPCRYISVRQSRIIVRDGFRRGVEQVYRAKAHWAYTIALVTAESAGFLTVSCHTVPFAMGRLTVTMGSLPRPTDGQA